MRTKANLFILLVAAPVAIGQSFNIDIGSITPGAPGGGTPAPVYGAAAHQPGTWNYITGIGTDSFQLVDLANNPTGVLCRRTDGLGGIFGWNSSMTTGYFQALMDDGHNTAIILGRAVTYTFHGLAPGRYVVTTYAWSPLDTTYRTRVTVAGSTSPTPHIVGGPLTAVNAFAVGITHCVDVVHLPPGTPLEIRAETAIGAGIINGFQISDAYGFSLSQSAPGGALTVGDTGGAPGNGFINLMTLNAGSFPRGQIFGLDMSLVEVANVMAFGVPFTGVLDAEGSMTFVVPPPLPTGLVVYCVGLEIDPAGPRIVSQLSPFSYTIN